MTTKNNLQTKFDNLVLPTIKEEDWKYTDLSDLKNKKFSLASDKADIRLDKFNKFFNKTDIKIVFVNNKLNTKLSNIDKLPHGLSISNLNKNTKAIKITASQKPQANSLEKLNNNNFQDGAFIEVAKQVKVKALIHILHILDSKEDNIINFPRTLILMRSSSQADIVESYISNHDNFYLSSSVTKIHLSDNAVLNYNKIQNENKKVYHIGTTNVWQKKDSSLETFSLAIGGKLIRNDLNIWLGGNGAQSSLNGLYIINKKQLVDNHTTVAHIYPNCYSTQLYKGLLNDKSKAIFNGKILVSREAQGTNSYQLNKNLLFGTDCQIYTKPQLEIFADDVKCTHGATVGQLDKNQVLYLNSRGINKKLATNMLANAFVNDVLEKTTNNNINKLLNKVLSNKINLIR